MYSCVVDNAGSPGCCITMNNRAIAYLLNCTVQGGSDAGINVNKSNLFLNYSSVCNFFEINACKYSS
jgi:hypothetical protein